MTHITVPMRLASGFQDYVEDRYDMDELVDEPGDTAYLDVDDATADKVRGMAHDAGLRGCVVTDLSAPEGLYEADGGLDHDRLIADVEGAIAYTLADRAERHEDRGHA